MFDVLQPRTSTEFKPPIASVPKSRPPMQIMRLLKLGIAVALLCVSLYAITVGQATITSDNAVLSAYTVSIRAPVAGTFADEGLRVGDNVPQGAVLGRLHNDLVDKQHLADLLGQAERSSAERQALEKQRVSLLDLQAGLLRRTADFQSTKQDYSAQGVEEALRTLQARMARNIQSRRDLERKLSLTRVGFAPLVDLEHLQADLAVSNNEIAAQAARVAKTRIQQIAGQRGLLLDNGSNDASYSSQRVDDITLRLTEIERAIASFTAAETEARDRLASERQRLSRLQDAVLTAPSAGTVWRVGASDGERLAVSDMAMELVDCRAGFILASIPQDRFGDVEIGGVAHFRMSGEKADRIGHILGVMGESDLAHDRNLAATPVPGRGNTVLARVEIPMQEGVCAVGRTARVLLQTNEGSGLVARLLRRVF